MTFGPSTRRFRHDLPSPVPPHPGDALLTPERAWLWRQVLARRCARLVVVVEDCFDPHNATAIVRTCDAFGVQRVCVTTARNGFKLNPRICQGSHLYMDLRVFPAIAPCIAELKAEGFRVLVSDLAAGAHVGAAALRPLLDERPLALVFGNEGSGVSAEATALADGAFLIPMVGFPQSLNLSVSVATTVYALRAPELAGDLPGDLPAAEQAALYDRWLRRHKGEAVDVLAGRPAQDRHGEAVEELRG